MDSLADKLPPLPVAIAMGGVVICVAVLLWVVSRLDASHGIIAVSLFLLVTFAAALVFSLIHTIPQDPSTEVLVGALAAAVGGLTTYWFRQRGKDE